MSDKPTIEEIFKEAYRPDSNIEFSSKEMDAMFIKLRKKRLKREAKEHQKDSVPIEEKK